MKLRFVSGNEQKLREISEYLCPRGIDLVPIHFDVEEVQSADLDAIVEDKCLKAFARIGHPLAVEHTALHLDALNGLPGGLTQLFWDSLLADRFVAAFGRADIAKGARAVTAIAYCDGARIYVFKGELRGRIAGAVAGSTEFEWDCVFIPDGETMTLAEMGSRKETLSMRSSALEKLLAHIGPGATR